MGNHSYSDSFKTVSSTTIYSSFQTHLLMKAPPLLTNNLHSPTINFNAFWNNMHGMFCITIHRTLVFPDLSPTSLQFWHPSPPLYHSFSFLPFVVSIISFSSLDVFEGRMRLHDSFLQILWTFRSPVQTAAPGHLLYSPWRLEVFKAVLQKTSVFWDVKPHRMVKSYVIWKILVPPPSVSTSAKRLVSPWRLR